MFKQKIKIHSKIYMIIHTETRKKSYCFTGDFFLSDGCWICDVIIFLHPGKKTIYYSEDKVYCREHYNYYNNKPVTKLKSETILNSFNCCMKIIK